MFYQICHINTHNVLSYRAIFQDIYQFVGFLECLHQLTRFQLLVSVALIDQLTFVLDIDRN